MDQDLRPLGEVIQEELSAFPRLGELLRAVGRIPHPPSPLVQEIADQLTAERASLAAVISEALRGEIPEYSAITDPLRLTELLVGCEQMISAFARILRSEAGLSSDEWQFVEALGRRRAEEGFPLAALVNAFHVGMNVGWEYMARRLEVTRFSPADANTVMGVALQLLNFIGDVTRTISAAYLAVAPSPAVSGERTGSVLVAHFLSGASLPEPELGARAAKFRAELGRPHAIVLIAGRVAEPELPEPSEDQREGPWVDAGESLVRLVEDALPMAVVATPVPHAAVLVPAMRSARWVELIRVCEELRIKHGVTILAVPPVAGAVPIYQSYISARDSLPLAGKVLQGQERVASPDDLQIYRVLQGRPEDRRSFLRSTLGPVLELQENRRRPLIDSLEAWFVAEGNSEEAARKLFVHPNTLRYRLRRVEELTGLSLRVPSHQVRLDLALHLLRMHSDSSEDESASPPA